MRLRFPFDTSPEIASGLALLFVVVLSLAVGWMAVSASDAVVTHISATPAFETGIK